jgi:diacylglycerol kinase
MSSSLLKSLQRAVRGVLFAFRTEPNMRRHTAAALLVFALVLVLPLAPWQIIVVLIVTVLVFVVELVNTAIELLVDLVKPQFHETARDVKDVSAGAVLLMVAAAVLVGLLIFGPYALSLIRHV